MSKRVTFMTLVGFVVAACSVSLQADEAQREKGEPKVKVQVDRNDAQADVDVDVDVKRADKTSQHPAIAHDKLVGLEIRDEAGKKFGEVSDLVIGLPDGDIRYAAVTANELETLEDKLIAVPWGALHLKQADNEQYFTMRIGQDVLAKAPTFETKLWPVRVNQQFWADVQIQPGEGQDRIRLGFRGLPEYAEKGKVPSAKRASNLAGMKVKTQDGEDVGEIDKLAIDASQGKVAFAVLAAGGFLGLGETDYAVSLNSLRMMQKPDDQDEYYLAMKITPERLKSAPKVEEKNFNDPEFRIKVDAYYETDEAESDVPKTEIQD